MTEDNGCQDTGVQPDRVPLTGQESHLRRLKRPNVVEDIPEGVPLNLEVVSVLEIDPEEIRRTEVARETEGRIGRDPPVAMNDLVDPPGRYADGDSNLMLGDPEREDEVLHQHLAGVDRG